ncbi:MAG: GIY-YIG nuclease family protein [Candidatus Thorarchaeota archaeon]
MPVFYVYIIETVAKNGKKRFYTGYTNNLYRRWTEHRSGKGAKFCRGKKHLELKYFEIYTNRKEAINRELEIKSFSRKQKKELINSIYI